MTHSPSKRARLQLRSRVRDDALLNRLLSEVRAHEKNVKDELRRADEVIADLRSDIGKEKAYASRVKKERDGARAKVDDALAELDGARRELADARASLESSEASFRRKTVELEANLADALRKKNRERVALDNVLKKKVTMILQRDVEKSLKLFLEKCDTTFRGSGVLFDAEASSSSEDEQAVAPPPAQAQTETSHLREEVLPAPSTSKAPELPIAAPSCPEPVPDSSSSTTSSESQ
jgi:predicted  nucleic acid-binding Zn-ribbon protein